jgi:hypothetical protein
MARRGKPLKTVTRFTGARGFTRLKPGENESAAVSWRIEVVKPSEFLARIREAEAEAE